MSSVKYRLWRAMNGVLARAGWELQPTAVVPRMSTQAGLEHAAAMGVAPRTVLDVGAAYGDWSLECAAVFPSARFVLVEPLAEYAPFLEAAMADIAEARLVRAAAGANEGTATLNVHADLVGTSFHHEHESGLESEHREVPLVTVDSLVADEPAGPYLLKVDVQGAELDVLAGSHAVLAEAELVVLEVSFLDFFERGARFEEVVAVMAEQGLAVYDLLGVAYRPRDGALSQADVLFVPREGTLRRDRTFADPEGRSAQNARFRAEYERRAAALRSR